MRADFQWDLQSHGLTHGHRGAWLHVAKNFPAHLIIQATAIPSWIFVRGFKRTMNGAAVRRAYNSTLRVLLLIFHVVAHHSRHAPPGASELLPLLGDLIVAQAFTALSFSEAPLAKLVGPAPVFGQAKLVEVLCSDSAARGWIANFPKLGHWLVYLARPPGWVHEELQHQHVLFLRVCTWVVGVGLWGWVFAQGLLLDFFRQLFHDGGLQLTLLVDLLGQLLDRIEVFRLEGLRNIAQARGLIHADTNPVGLRVCHTDHRFVHGFDGSLHRNPFWATGSFYETLSRLPAGFLHGDEV